MQKQKIRTGINCIFAGLTGFICFEFFRRGMWFFLQPNWYDLPPPGEELLIVPAVASVLLTVLAAIFFIKRKEQTGLLLTSIAPALAGLALTYFCGIKFFFAWVMFVCFVALIWPMDFLQRKLKIFGGILVGSLLVLLIFFQQKHVPLGR